MYKSLMFVAIATLVSSSTFATGPTPSIGSVVVTGSGSNQVTSQSAAMSAVNGAGSSLSKASNMQSAAAFVTGSGSITSKPANQYVNLADCDPAVKVSGTLLNGSIQSTGGTSVYGLSNASNVSTGGGVGQAVAGGLSVAEVTGNAVGTAPNFSLAAEGSAYSGVATFTQATTNQAGATSEGATSSSYVANAAGSLFTFKNGNTIGDIKTVTTNVVTRAGDLTCGTNCVKAIATNATVEAGANGNAFADVKATFSKP